MPSSEKSDPEKLQPAVSHEEGYNNGSNSGGSGKFGGLAGDLAAEQAENARLANPLIGKSDADLRLDAERFCQKNDMMDSLELMKKAAVVAGRPLDFDDMPELTEDEKASLRVELTNKWKQPKTLWLLVICCSMAAVVQGQDQSLINGANIFWPEDLGVAGEDRIIGLVNAAPYFACVIFACWLTDPLNRYFGRKGAILISLVFACIPCIWAGLANSWVNLLISRIVLSIGIGPKSSTVPVYAAESAPPAIRGAMVMMWQMWTAFGIMMCAPNEHELLFDPLLMWFMAYSGTVCSLMFYDVSSPSIQGLNWRLMLGSGCVPPIIVFLQVIFLPESPRWLLEKGRANKAFQSLRRLRHSDIEAARDLFYISALLDAEAGLHTGNRYIELFSKPRNRRAAQGAGLVMFMQQFCGINAIAYYSTTIFVESGISEKNSLIASWGFGMTNWLFALPAIWTIDRFGRRFLLLWGFPMMSFWLFFTGGVFYLPESTGRLAAICLGIYIFSASYSPSEGPVPFTYSAEVFPLTVRPIGMSFATAVCWGFNGIIAFTFPMLRTAFTPSGAFFWYAGWNIVGYFLVLMFLPETKELSLEELDQVFSIPTRKHAAWGLRQPAYWFRRYIMRQDVEKEVLFEVDPNMQRTYVPKSGGH